MSAGILAQDAEPSLYACEQEYEILGQRKRRLGFTCLVRLEDYERRTVPATRKHSRGAEGTTV